MSEDDRDEIIRQAHAWRERAGISERKEWTQDEIRKQAETWRSYVALEEREKWDVSIDGPGTINLRKKCLNTALRYTSQDRNAAHGDPENNFRNIAAFWNAHLRARYAPTDVVLDATDVALMMAGMKAARLAFNPTHEDSWIDLAGYAACGMDVALRRGEPTLEEMRAWEMMEDQLPDGYMREGCPFDDPHRHADGRLYAHYKPGT